MWGVGCRVQGAGCRVQGRFRAGMRERERARARERARGWRVWDLGLGFEQEAAGLRVKTVGCGRRV